MSIKEIVFKAVENVGVGHMFTLGTLVRTLDDNGRGYVSDETILRRLRELRQEEGRIDYVSIGKCKFRLLYINNGVEQRPYTGKDLVNKEIALHFLKGNLLMEGKLF